jgi:hypothetical protein
VAGCCIYGNETLGSVNVDNFLNGCVTVTFARRTPLDGINPLKPKLV